MINKKTGIIGFGSMGSMLLNGFIDSNKIKLSSLFVSTRSKEKLSALKNKNITICSSNNELIKKCNLIFICVKPLEIKHLLDEIKNELTGDKHIISIIGSLSINNIEKIFKGKISRVIPTLISEVKEGITLTCHNSKVLEEDKTILNELLGSISKIKNIPENEFEIISIITSCAPGLIASIFKEFSDVAALYTNLDKNELNDIIIKTLYGTGKLFYECNYGFDHTINRVATKGGTTEAGVQIIKEKIPGVFNKMFKNALERQKTRKQKIGDRFKT